MELAYFRYEWGDGSGNTYQFEYDELKDVLLLKIRPGRFAYTEITIPILHGQRFKNCKRTYRGDKREPAEFLLDFLKPILDQIASGTTLKDIMVVKKLEQ